MSEERVSDERTERNLMRAFYAGFLVWAIYMLVEVRSWSSLEDWLLPTLFGVPLVVTILLKLVTVEFPGIEERFLPEVEETGDELQDHLEGALEREETLSKAEQLRSGAVISAWVIAFVALLYVLGFWVVLPAFTFVFAWYLLGDLTKSVLITVLFSAAAYVLFVLILEAFIWEGLIFG